jgi:hypothetical protein
MTGTIWRHEPGKYDQRFGRSGLANFEDQLLGLDHLRTLPPAYRVRLRSLDAECKKGDK